MSSILDWNCSKRYALGFLSIIPRWMSRKHQQKMIACAWGRRISTILHPSMIQRRRARSNSTSTSPVLRTRSPLLCTHNTSMRVETGLRLLSRGLCPVNPLPLPAAAQPVRLAYQPPASSTFLSEQISHQQPASSTLLSEQTSTSHQPPANRTGCWNVTSATTTVLHKPERCRGQP
jgi:hypothetical protein